MTSQHPQETIRLETGRGVFLIRSFCTPDQIRALRFRGPPVQGDHYRPVVTRKERLIQASLQEGVNVTLAFREGGEIAGLSILEYPGPCDRWLKVGDRDMMEVSIIEVMRPWRRLGLARNILRLTMAHPRVESLICYMVGYSWTWDLDADGVTAMAYRENLIRLFAAEGFRTMQTNEPNVMLRPENLFMARIGSAVLRETVERFKLARFNLL